MVRGAHLFILSIEAQAGLDLMVVVGRNATNISQCSMT
jgi:hypothetical protein